MFQLIQPIASLFVGVAMTIYGIGHVITKWPSGEVIATLVANMPVVTTVLVFLLGIVALAAGIVLMVLGIKNMRRRWREFNQIANHVGTRPQYDDDQEGWEPAYR